MCYTLKTENVKLMIGKLTQYIHNNRFHRKSQVKFAFNDILFTRKLDDWNTDFGKQMK